MYFIIKGKEESNKRLKGKNLTELSKNLESQGWPREWVSEEARERVKHFEEKTGRPAKSTDIAGMAKEMRRSKK